MANVKLSDDVMEILKRSTITGNQLVLPAGQLERKMYEAVNKALVAAGGKWNTKAKAHVFDSDPRKKLGLMLETGVAIDEKKKFQAFYTPEALAAKVARLADVVGHVVLEPSAGDGALADACKRAGALAVHCVELNPDAVAKLKAKGYETTEGDFLTIVPKKYLRIVMNPPFTGNQDVKHVEHALKFLAPGGILVAVMFGNTDRKRFDELVHYLPCSIEEVPAGTFKESGTNIATILLTVKG
jgi:hypothetical protein